MTLGPITNRSHTIQLDQTILEETYPRNLLPGDLLCTYEDLSLRPTSLMVKIGQAFTTAGRNLHHMVHFSIVTDTTANTRHYHAVEIAHADGLSKTLTLEKKIFDKDDPGTKTVIFRPKNSQLAQEIVSVAKTVTNSHNAWRLKTIGQEIMSRINYQLSTHNKQEKRIKQVTRIAIDSFEQFKSKDGSPKAMHCAKFAVNVIVAASLRCRYPHIFSDPQQSNEEKSAQLIEELKKTPELGVVPELHLSSQCLSSASLTEAMLDHPEHWETPGFIGYHTTGDNQVAPRTYDSPIIQDEQFAALEIGDPHRIRATLQNLGIADAFGHLSKQMLGERSKMAAAFAYLSAWHNISSSLMTHTTDVLEFEIEIDQVLEKLASITSNQDSDIEREFQNFSDQLRDLAENPSQKDSFYSKCGALLNGLWNTAKQPFEPLIFSITPLQIEKKYLKMHAASIKEHKQILEQNSAGTDNAHRRARADLAINQVNKYDNLYRGAARTVALVSIGGLLYYEIGSRFFFPPPNIPDYSNPVNPRGTLPALFLMGTAYVGRQLQRTFTYWKGSIEESYRATAHTHQLELTSDVGYGLRPWITYTTDGIHWTEQPFVQKPNTIDGWKVDLRLEKPFDYQLYLTPFKYQGCNPRERVTHWLELPPQTIEPPNNTAQDLQQIELGKYPRSQWIASTDPRIAPCIEDVEEEDISVCSENEPLSESDLESNDEDEGISLELSPTPSSATPLSPSPSSSGRGSKQDSIHGEPSPSIDGPELIDGRPKDGVSFPQYRFQLKSDVGIGSRPWVIYSTNGIDWHEARLDIIPGSMDEWIIDLPIMEDIGDLQYKFYVVNDYHYSGFDSQKHATKWIDLSEQNCMNLHIGHQELFSLTQNDQGIRAIPKLENPGWISCKKVYNDDLMRKVL